MHIFLLLYNYAYSVIGYNHALVVITNHYNFAYIAKNFNENTMLFYHHILNFLLFFTIFIDNLISFFKDKFNCLDTCLKKIEEKVLKFDALEENTHDVREMRRHINKIVDLVEFLNSAN